MYKFPSHKFPFTFGQREIFRIEERLKPHVFINKYFHLSKTYAVPGKMKLFHFQEFIVDLIERYECVIVIGPTQTGKSLVLEAMLFWLIYYTKENMMLLYENDEKLREVFKERLLPMLLDNPILRNFLTGYDDDLTSKKMNLKDKIIRAAGAGKNAKSSISTHNAGVILADELAKWIRIKGFSQLKALEGRTQSTKMANRKVYKLLGSSPQDDLDQSYTVSHDTQADFFRPHFRCIHCKSIIQIRKEYLREKPNSIGELDHDPSRIEKDQAAYYECQVCHKPIEEDDRREMVKDTVFLTVDCNEKYKGIELKKNAKKAVVNWHRLLYPYYTFHDMLSAYYSAEQSDDIMEMQTHLNEDWAEWKETKSNKKDTRQLYNSTLKYRYRVYIDKDKTRLPNFMQCLFLGIDSQDNGFYYSIRGCGANGESGMVKSGFIPCPLVDPRYIDKEKIADLIKDEIVKKEYITQDGRSLNFLFGLIDRGGHRPADVDMIASKIPWLYSYIGDAHAQNKKDIVIEYSGKGWYLGNSYFLSQVFASKLESPLFHLPENYDSEYGRQILGQFWENYIDTHGRKRNRWVCERDDHLRDCENLIEGCIYLTKFDQISQYQDQLTALTTPQDSTEKEDAKALKTTPRVQKPRKTTSIEAYKKEMKAVGW